MQTDPWCLLYVRWTKFVLWSFWLNINHFWWLPSKREETLSNELGSTLPAAVFNYFELRIDEIFGWVLIKKFKKEGKNIQSFWKIKNNLMTKRRNNLMTWREIITRQIFSSNYKLIFEHQKYRKMVMISGCHIQFALIHRY